MAALASIEERIRAIVGAEHMWPAHADDAVRGVLARFVAEPGTDEEVAAILRCADEAGLVVIPRAGGTKLEWGNAPRRADLVLSLRRLDRVVEHAWADMTVTVQAGCTITCLQETLAQHGQRLAVDPLWPDRATVGGILATNDSGALRLRYGALRDLIIGVSVALADGTLAASGGRVVKNVAGYDLSKLMTGALGTLGIITQATFRIHPRPHATRTLSFSVGSVDAVQGRFDAIQDSTLAHATLQARLASDTTPVVDVLFEGTEGGLSAQEAAVQQIAGAANASTDTASAWAAREGLWAWASGAVAKLSVLPADMGETIEYLNRLARPHGTHWQAVMQATGLALVRFDGSTDAMKYVLPDLRAFIESREGSLVVLRQPEGTELDAWGSGGDALPLMRAVKQQLDPRATLNPGRFVGGI